MSTPSPVSAKPPQPPRLLELVRQVARTRFGQEGPGERFAHWTYRLVLFHAICRPATSAASSNTLSRRKKTR